MNIEYPVSRPVLIAYYLPQYYEMDINTRIYGKGYTEWRQLRNNTASTPSAIGTIGSDGGKD